MVFIPLHIDIENLVLRSTLFLPYIEYGSNGKIDELWETRITINTLKQKIQSMPWSALESISTHQGRWGL